MPDSAIAYIGLGSNQGDRQQYLTSALKAISQAEGLRLLRTSRVIETEAMAMTPQPMYFNQTAEVKTTLNPEALLATLLDIENRLGRIRTETWGQRTIDLDLLLYDNQAADGPSVCVPHRQLHFRSFVLAGLLELCPQLIHPILGHSMTVLSQRLNGQNYFADSGRPQLISIAGIIGVGKTTLMRELRGALGAEPIYEEFDKNPYLAEVYDGHKELALDSELYFLSSSVRQLSYDKLQAGRIYINDYIFEKALIYARSWLDNHHLVEYEKIYPEQHKKAVRPVLVVYIEDSVQHCLERIHRRRRPFEQGIQPEFLANLEMWYNELFSDWKTCPVIRVHASQCKTAEQVQSLSQEVRRYLAV